MPATTPKTPTLADLIVIVLASNLSALQKRDCVSAIRRGSRALGAEPGDLPINVKLLRRRLEEVSPEAIGMTRATFNNVRSLFNRALELYAPIMTVRRQNIWNSRN